MSADRRQSSPAKPGYDEAAEAMAELARRPRCSDWGEGLTEARIRALLDAAYPIIVEAWMGPLAEWRKDMRDAHMNARADERRRIVQRLREAAQAEHDGRGIGQRAADFIEKEFGDA